MLRKFLAESLDNLSYFYMGTQKKRRSESFYAGGLEAFLEESGMEDPISAFTNPGTVPELTFDVVTRRGNYNIKKFHFESFVDTPHRINNIVFGRHYEMHGRPDAPTVLVLHGYRMESYMLFDRYCRFLIRNGFNVVLVDLPYHMNRRAPDTFHGELTFSEDPVLTLKVMKQSVLDVMAVMNWLAARGVRQIGLYGVSYGAMLAGVIGCIDPGVDFLVMVAPPADLTEVFIKSKLGRLFEDQNPKVREMLVRYQTVLDKMALANLTPLVPRDHIFIAEGTYDQMVPTELIEKLWRAWGRPMIKRYPQGHLSVIIFNAQLDADLRQWFKKIKREKGDGRREK